MEITKRIDALRKYMMELNIDAYIVPTEDFHGSEYVGDFFKAREYLSGFTGSAGTLVLLSEEAALWTDGRYYLQAEQQLKGSGILLMRSGQPGVPKLADYLLEKLPQNGLVGFDGRTVSRSFVEELQKKLCSKGIHFVGEFDLVDNIWENRPAISKKPVWELDKQYAGKSREEKLILVREDMQKEKVDVLVLTALDEIAWLLNLRGKDVAYTPVFLSYMLVMKTESILYVYKEILSQDVIAKLKMAAIRIEPYEKIYEDIAELCEYQKVWIDKKNVNNNLIQQLPETCTFLYKPSPIAWLKAVKTQEEMKNIRQAHIKDGVAVVRFLYWLKRHVGTQTITECTAAEKLLQFRQQQEGFLDQSFAPIIAYEAHGAIVHYEATPDTDALLEPKGLCLADTGGHYLEGTTDITRTIVLGPLTEEEKRAYTLVLRGHLNLGMAQFPYGVCGQNLDCLARMPLWEKQMDYNHGTGHGVGYLLGVHEGPHSINWRILPGGRYTPLEEGMLISNEPGLYMAGKFGIRHENMMLCRKGKKTEYGQFMWLETLTMVPFEPEAILLELMREEEIEALNAYHQKVYDTIAPYLNSEEREWLAGQTAPIEK